MLMHFRPTALKLRGSCAIAVCQQHAASGGLALLATTGMLLAACTGTAEQASSIVTPSAWTYSQHGSTGLPDEGGQAWWRRFDDPKLNRLIDSALARNTDLAKAALNVKEAQLISELEGDPLRFGPQASLSAVTGRRLDNGSGIRERSSSLQARASYTLDLWGRLDQQRDIARWALEASEFDRQTVRLNTIATTADLYWKLAYFNQRVDSAEKSLATAMRTQLLVQAQSIAGAVSALERREAEQTVLTQRSSLSQLRQAQVETRNALAVLFDSAPGNDVLLQILGDEPQKLPDGELPSVQEGLPAALLGRRPDLRSAELALHQSLANVDVVRTSYYPNLSLTGALGSTSNSLADLLANPTATLGTGVSLAFLDLKAMRRDTQVAQVQYEASIIQFRQTLYQAFADVENALSSRAHLTEQAELQAQNLVAAREAERLYAIRYRAGAVALRMWLDAQESLRNAELLLAQARLSQLQNLNTLYLSLGGDMTAPSKTTAE
ncbi:efflux transporter outer membrane subunit [Pseudomonas sp. NPDC087615]|uniref:efflux transporter outer membrane subunit n=1 Tax=Pseudomonas sp. NPDC087615 TaxID=3364443 RepID=UPI003813CF4F